VKKWLNIWKDEKAVSPVIGVILMVAITVILAAVIASFVFGIGSKTPKSAPQVSLQVSAVNDSAIIISDQGGTPIPWDHIKVIVTNSTTSWYAQLEYNTSAKATGYVSVKSGNLNIANVVNPGSAAYFNPGEQFELYNSTTTFGSSGDVITVKVVDTSSGQVLLNAQVSLP